MLNVVFTHKSMTKDKYQRIASDLIRSYSCACYRVGITQMRGGGNKVENVNRMQSCTTMMKLDTRAPKVLINFKRATLSSNI